MINTTTLILTRVDLLPEYNSVPVSELSRKHFNVDPDIWMFNSVIIFVDEDCHPLFLKLYSSDKFIQFIHAQQKK